MRGPRAFRIIGAVAALTALGGTACSVLFGFDGFTGDGVLSPEGGGKGDGAGGPGDDDGGPPFVGVPCGSDGVAGVCLPPVPNGWDGPVLLAEGAPDASLPSCPGADLPPVKGFTGLDAGPATCGACACSTGTPSCSAPQLTPVQFPFDTCGAGGTMLTPGGCTSLIGFGFGGSKAGVTGVSVSPDCTATGGAATLPPAEFSAAGEACSAAEIPTGTCPSGNTCRKIAPGGFLANKYCIYTRGDQGCPREVYSERHEYGSSSLDDNRGCTPCDCSATGGACDTTGLTVTFYGDNGCSDAGTVLTVPSACSSVNGGGSSMPRSARLSAAATLSQPPTCTPRSTTSSPRGSAQPGNMYTVCCTR